MRKFWIFMAILFAVVFIIALACAVSPDWFRPLFVSGAISAFGTVAITINDTWTGIAANPVYQQWHMLIWFIGGIIGTIIFTKVLWPRRPRWKAAPSIPVIHQHRIETDLPHSVSEPVPETVAKTKPKEEVKAEEAVAT